MAARADVIITAGLRPELFAGANLLKASRTLVITTMALLVLAGFGLRVAALSAEGLSEDELNKLNAVTDYRQHGITSANGEHPMLMKTLQTISIVAAEMLGSARVSPETALRLPSAIFGALTIILIYLLTAELFGAEVALIAAALWAFDPSAIGFNRIAKEDTFLLFFFLLANIFWLRGQRVAESDSGRPQPYYWATAVAFGAMIASKYLPQLFAITISYYWIFQQIPETRWRLGKKRLLIFFAIIGLTFLVLSPAILLPGTWREMGLFAGQKMVVHDGYEFMGRVYTHRLTEWLRGIPWYFYFVFMGVKLPLLTIVGFLLGLPLLFRRRLGDGRYFILFWLFFWVITFTFPGGKFTRYFTVMLPAVLITAAIGVQFVGRWLARIFTSLSDGAAVYARTAVGLLVVAASLLASAGIAPHFRLYTNALGGGVGKAGFYFPHDEFYDASMRDLIAEIARLARPGARVASESPSLAAYYSQRVNRSDLVCIWLSDARSLKELGQGDFVINARGRRYFSNDALISSLQRSANPVIQLSLGPVPSAQVYLLDRASLNVVNEQKSSDK